MFDIVISRSKEISNLLVDWGDDDKGRRGTLHIIELILQLTPKVCWVRDAEGRLPLQNIVSNHDLVRLVRKSYPHVDWRCPLTGL